MARQPGTRPVLAPTITVTADTAVDRFEDGQKLSTWHDLYAFARAWSPGTKASDDQIRAIYLAHPGDDTASMQARVEAMDAIEATSIADDAKPRSAIDDTRDQSRKAMMALGAMLDEEANKHFDQLTGKAKEDFDGSVVVIMSDLKRVDKASDGTFLSELLTFEPDTFPIGTETKRNKEPHPKALPSGSNATPEFYPINGGKDYGSRVVDFCDGTSYGSALLKDQRVLAALQAWQKKPEENQKPAADAIKAFCEKWRVTGSIDGDARAVDGFKKRIDDRKRNFQNKVRLGLRVLLQWDRMESVKGLSVNWVHRQPELRAASSAPVWLMYEYTDPESGDKLRPTTRHLTLSTFCNYNVNAAMQHWKPGQNFLERLQATAGRGNADPEKKKPKINLDNPSGIAVWHMATSIGYFLKEADGVSELEEWLNDKKEGDVRKEAFHEAARLIERFDRDYVADDVQKIVNRRNRSAAEQKQKEADAIAKVQAGVA